MRFLLVLTALMLAVAAGVWWKTSREDDPVNALDPDPNLGVTLFGVEPEAPTPTKANTSQTASLEKEPAIAAPASSPLGRAGPADAVGAGAQKPPAGGGDPREPQTAANEKQPTVTTPGPTAYTARDGDTLYRIVLRAYGTAPGELVTAVSKANGMSDPSQLRAGQKLTLPSLAGWPAPKKL